MWTVDKESPCKVVVTAAHLLLAARPRALFIVDRHARVCLARAARPSIRRSFIQHLLSEVSHSFSIENKDPGRGVSNQRATTTDFSTKLARYIHTCVNRRSYGRAMSPRIER
jgi:hypothetical protein